MKRLWRQLYTCEQAEIEEEHRQLLAVIGRYYGALTSARLLCGFRQQLLEELVEQAGRHFRHEGEILLQIGHPQAQHHLREHECILAGLGQWMQTGVSKMATRKDLHALDDLLVHQIREDGLPQFRQSDA